MALHGVPQEASFPSSYAPICMHMVPSCVAQIYRPHILTHASQPSTINPALSMRHAHGTPTHVVAHTYLCTRRFGSDSAPPTPPRRAQRPQGGTRTVSPCQHHRGREPEEKIFDPCFLVKTHFSLRECSQKMPFFGPLCSGQNPFFRT